MDRILGGLPMTQPLSDIPPVEEPILGGDVRSIFRPTETYTDKAKGLADAGLSLFGALVHGVPAQFMGAMGPEFQAKRFRPPQTPAGERYFETAAEALGKVGEAFPLQPSAFTTPMNVLAAPAAAQAASKASQVVNNAEITQRVNQALQAAGGRLEKAVEAQVNKTMEKGGLPAEILQGMTQNTASQVIKGKGGNWLEGIVERSLEPLKSQTIAGETPAERIPRHEELLRDPTLTPESRQTVERHLSQERQRAALDNWIDRNLTNYVKKEMGTPEDPVRKLAEQGIVHKPSRELNLNSQLEEERVALGMPAKPMAQTESGQFWENIADIRIKATPAEVYKYNDYWLKNNPWLSKLPDETKVYTADLLSTDLGFDHIVDVLREDLQTGRIRPEQLNKVSMEQAVRRTYEYDQEKAKEAARAALQQQEGLPVVKSYPEGYKWLELHDKNDAKKTEEALSYEGKTMGHCVGSYCPDVLEGKSQIFSLRDSKGEPHVTIEVVPKVIDPKDWLYAQSDEIANDIKRQTSDRPTSQEMYEAIVAHPKYQEDVANAPKTIAQIKGKGNRAPKEDYLPFVQDFVKSQDWGSINELRNAKMVDITKEPDIDRDFVSWLKSKNLLSKNRYITEQEFEATGSTPLNQLKEQWGKEAGEGFKEGGLATNTDTIKSRLQNQGMPEDKAFIQALRLANEVQMAGGGSLRNLKNLPAAAKAAKVTKPVDILPPEESQANLGRFLEPSQVKERMYHGSSTKEPITEFKTGRMIKEEQYPGNTIESWAVDNRDAVFLTPEPTFSGKYSGDEWEISGGRRPTTYPVYVQAKKPWDYENPEHIEQAIQAYKEKFPLQRDQSGVPSQEAMRHYKFENTLRGLPAREKDNWSAIESADLQNIIKSLGYDSFYVKEAGIKNLGVYDPSKIKSAIGNRGTYDVTEKDITKAKGGLASLKGLPAAARAAKSKYAEEAAAAGRAAPRSKQEIESIAERISQQTQPGFVRQDPAFSVNPEGKSRAVYELEQRTPMIVESTIEDTPLPAIDYEKQLGSVIVGVPGDPTIGQVKSPGSLYESTKAGKRLMQVGDVTPETPVELYGGPSYGTTQPESYWASNISAARGIRNFVNEMAEKHQTDKILGQYMKMSPESSRYAMHNLDALISVLQPEKLSSDKVEMLNKLVREGDKANKFPQFVGFEDPIDLLLQAQMNSNLRKRISEVLEKPTTAKAVGFPFQGSVVQTAITEPGLRNLETGVTGYSVGRMKPQSELTLSRHPTYEYDIPGQLIGRSKYPIPYELAFPDFTQWFKEHPELAKKVDPFNMLKSVGARQKVDPQYVDEIKMYEEAMKRLTGKKKGGKVSGLSALNRK